MLKPDLLSNETTAILAVIAAHTRFTIILTRKVLSSAVSEAIRVAVDALADQKDEDIRLHDCFFPSEIFF